MRIAVIALGCPKNLVDTEVMLGLLDEAGHTFTDAAEEADLVIVSTCSFISAAVQESSAVVSDCLRLRDAAGPLRGVVVAGCLPQRYGRRTFDIFPGVDAVVGCSGFGRIVDVVRDVEDGRSVFMVDAAAELYDETYPRILGTPGHLAYVKIADGCDNRCAYCTIPSIRGPLRSRTSESLVREVEALAEAGVREISLIAQDTTAYGTDIASPVSLTDLLVSLSQTGAMWIRLLYTHPAHVTEQLLSAIAETEHVVPYLDMPIQHISDRILTAMGRGVSGDRIRELVGLARDSIPGVSIRSSVIVGFPGETSEEFEEIRGFLAEGNIDYLGVFEFSPERGTPAFDFGGRIDDETSSARARELVAVMERLAERRGRATTGLDRAVLIDRETLGSDVSQAAGRTAGQAWETDGEVLIECSGSVPTPGDFVKVTITGARGFDLTARLGAPAARAADRSETA
ncbi:MAG: 30S ribosomal protein S12 methylthiotransferase RimO [Candidatus Eisenbacteria bacterium]|nr:30S ribosomal protein S12 methylthiotransferase RimO [Candidatus Eisenbacteria bacterium]